MYIQFKESISVFTIAFLICIPIYLYNRKAINKYKKSGEHENNLKKLYKSRDDSFILVMWLMAFFAILDQLGLLPIKK